MLGVFITLADLKEFYLVTTIKLFIFISIWGNLWMKTQLYSLGTNEYAELFILPAKPSDLDIFYKM